MTDAAGRRQLVRFSGRRRTQIAELARRFENIDSAVVVQGNAGRIISPVFQIFQPRQQNFADCAAADVTHYSAHNLSSPAASSQASMQPIFISVRMMLARLRFLIGRIGCPA